jgi:hypothetical protein
MGRTRARIEQASYWNSIKRTECSCRLLLQVFLSLQLNHSTFEAILGQEKKVVERRHQGPEPESNG